MKTFFKNNYPIVTVSFFILILHLYNNAFTTYGYFRDELYYIACSNHPDLGYVDQPPLAVLFLLLNRLLFGDSLFSIRLFPSIAHALTVFIGAIISRKLGGKIFAQVLTALCIGLAPGLLGMFGIFSVNAFDIVLWQTVFLLIIRLNETQNPKYWLWIGIVIGIGLMSKISMGWLAAGIFIGVIASPMRKWLKGPYPWIAACLSLLLFSPFIFWNFQHDFAHLEFARNASGFKYASQSPITFLFGMLPNYNFAAFPVWLIGFFALYKQEKKEMRVLFYSVITILLILLINGHSKTEYFNPAIVILFAAGSIQIEQWFTTSRRKNVAYAYLAIIVLFGFVTLPFAIDIMPVNSFIQYSQTLGQTPSSSEGKSMRELPQHFADRFGWEELASDVAIAYNTLNETEKTRCVVYGNNYGEASAINFFGKKYELPQAISGHNSYWLWGCGNKKIDVVIIIGGRREDHLNTFENVEISSVHSHPFAMPYESDMPIYICRHLKVPIATAWEKSKNYN